MNGRVDRPAFLITCTSAGILGIAGGATASAAFASAAPVVSQAIQPNPYQDISTNPQEDVSVNPQEDVSLNPQEDAATVGPNQWEE